MLVDVFYLLVTSIVRGIRALSLSFLKLFKGVAKAKVKKTFMKAGVRIHIKSGAEEIKDQDPWDIVAKDEELVIRVANHATLGLGEAYMDGVWECDDLVELSYRIMRKNLFTKQYTPLYRLLHYLELTSFNLQTKSKAWEVGQKHYDLGNDLFESFLDPAMNYSCGYWAKAENLTQAQLDKMELIAQKLKLKPGMKVLDIGCGWGGLVKYLAENYKVQCVGITISKEGAKGCRERCANLPVDIRLMDYRDLDEKFDRIVSVGMFEHVGEKNYAVYLDTARKCLTEDGIFLLHTIGVSHGNMFSTDAWFHKYIFPNGQLPYFTDVAKYLRGRFIVEDWHNFGYDYSRTLIAWRDNFIKNWPKISHKYGERFYRMWTYYLQTSAGGFKSRRVQLWQIVLTKSGYPGGYRAPR